MSNDQRHLNDEHSLSLRHALLQETWSIHEAEVGICDGKKCKLRLCGREALSREAYSNIHRARGYASVRKVRGQAGEARLAHKRPSYVDEELAIGEAYLRGNKGHHVGVNLTKLSLHKHAELVAVTLDVSSSL